MRSPFLFLLALASFATALPAAPSPTPSPKQTSIKSDKKGGGAQISPAALAQSANGWTYVKGEWVHPEGYKFVGGRILRTTARTGKAAPQPPGKLALANPEQVAQMPLTVPAATSAKTAADKAAERARNLAPRPASQTGTHM